MPAPIHFRKMQGLGNDYVYVDAMAQPAVLLTDLGALSRRISDRHFGIGSDGLIVLCAPSERLGDGAGAHVRMRMFNADGSEAQMCGNGIRCVAKFAHDHLGMRAQPLLVETGRGVLAISYSVRDGSLATATVDMGEPIFSPQRIPTLLAPTRDGMVVGAPLDGFDQDAVLRSLAAAGGVELAVTCVSMGNPHAVLLCARPQEVELERLGPLLENAGVFPERANISVMAVIDRGQISGRIWERGSGVTLASGTGACAMVVAGVLLGLVDRAARVVQPGGELEIVWDEASNHVFKSGPAVEVFEGWVAGQ